ncbi:hypothetical protein GXW83_21910 [Streptacidiphilus sp. PB12-B1b]|uniref:hypothetical protein n=1 Tax=Streptacidiphilus sp. PB12-B1b TaxID=2705012 RepID=UPI0015F89AFF|nr:hypothetical protein [Streptacidiphilus sp. PB12-B1b]QMU77956.1 hypothetical protein GXW83_21910 [Streptacidiphilus sp. PB12-B1b]
MLLGLPALAAAAPGMPLGADGYRPGCAVVLVLGLALVALPVRARAGIALAVCGGAAAGKLLTVGHRRPARFGPGALHHGPLVNCRGVTDLVVARIGRQLHLIGSTGLTVLVIMALVTSGITVPLLRSRRTFARPTETEED